MDKLTLDKTVLDKRLPPPLPDSLPDWQRITKARRTLNDLVEDVHRALVADNDQRYERLLYAVYDEQALEGGLSDDNTFAAIMIRDKAKKMNVQEVATALTATIRKCLFGVVLRRYGQSRKQRRNMIGGEIVTDGSED